MNNDLISRKAVLERLQLLRKLNTEEAIQIAIDAVEQQISFCKAAFDKEKVIEELEYDKEMSAKYNTGLREQGHIEAFDEAISIVKKGGINNILL